MKKRIAAALLAALLIFASGCSRGKKAEPVYKGGSIIDAVLGTGFGEPETAAPTEAEKTAAPVNRADIKDGAYPCFDGMAVIGNSRIETFLQLGLWPNVDLFAKVGLTIRNMYTENMRGSDLCVFDDALQKEYSKMLIVLGDNESGWPYQNVYIDELNEAMEKLSEAHPQTKIYIQAILPISKTAEALDENIDCGYNMENINAMNKLLFQYCADHGYSYVGIPDGFTDEEGYLMEDAATDGVHFGKKYCLMWIDYLADLMEEN